MFEHSVKVPRHYKIAANIFKKVSTEGGSVKTLLYDDKLRHFRTNVLFALITETIKHATQIDKIFESSGILVAEPRFDPWLAKVLTAEILYGKKALPGKSKPEQTILSYKDKFQTYIIENGDDTNTKVIAHRPRYVRINTNLLTTSDAIRAFQDEGYKFIRCTSGSYDDYLQQIQNLTEYDFTQDYHVKTIFVFSSGTKLHDHELYYENKIILQDKATAMAVHLLAPPSDSVILDMCAAPGMKTTQVAAYIRNQGKIYAVERNEERYGTLCDFVDKTGSKCVETLHKDALELKRGEYDDVEYILLDPSCSGSGMQFSVHNYVEDTRMARLTSLQEKFLKHAMNAFPKAKRIVYSTCSLYPEENERVVTNVVKTSRAKWRVQDVKELLKGNWNNFGSGMYGTMGARCLYAKPETDLTTGFFLAVLDRDQNDMDKCQRNNAENEDRKHKINTNKEYNGKGINTIEENTQNTNDDDQKIKPKVKKEKRKKDKECDILESVNMPINNDDDKNENINDDNARKSKKKKKKVVEEQEKIIDISNKKSKKQKNTDESNPEAELLDISDVNGFPQKKKKKIKKENTEDSEFVNNNQVSDFIDLIQKKKKKSKKEWNAFAEFIDTSQVSEYIDVPPKKKKKNKAESNKDAEFLDTNQGSDSIDLLPKKKKKIKPESNADAELPDTSQISNCSDLPPKKKKKNKTECNADTEFPDTSQISDSNDLPRKKKKKIKTRDLTLEIDHSSNSNDPAKKKNKENNVDFIHLHFDHVIGVNDLPKNIKKRRKHVD